MNHFLFMFVQDESQTEATASLSVSQSDSLIENNLITDALNELNV